MENDPFIDGLPIENGDFPWLLNNQMVYNRDNRYDDPLSIIPHFLSNVPIQY